MRIPLTHYVWDLVVFRLVCLRLCLFIYRIAVQLFWAANGKREGERERERLRAGKGWGYGRVGVRVRVGLTLGVVEQQR